MTSSPFPYHLPVLLVPVLLLHWQQVQLASHLEVVLLAVPGEGLHTAAALVAVDALEVELHAVEGHHTEGALPVEAHPVEVLPAVEVGTLGVAGRGVVVVLAGTLAVVAAGT